MSASRDARCAGVPNRSRLVCEQCQLVIDPLTH